MKQVSSTYDSHQIKYIIFIWENLLDELTAVEMAFSGLIVR